MTHMTGLSLTCSLIFCSVEFGVSLRRFTSYHSCASDAKIAERGNVAVAGANQFGSQIFDNSDVSEFLFGQKAVTMDTEEVLASVGNRLLIWMWGVLDMV